MRRIKDIEGFRKKSRLSVKNDVPLRDNVFIQLINTAYSLLLNTSYRSSETVTVAFHIRFHISVFSFFRAYPTDCLSFVSEYKEEEVTETMAETMEKYTSKTRADYGSGVARPKIEDNDNFELKGQFLKELRTNTFSGSDHEDANEHIGKVLKIVDLFCRILDIITQPNE
nr:hypothetical protein [Tanacetum cinerariifolium]